MWYINLDRSFYRFVTIHACDGRTDRRKDRILIARPRLHSMQRGNKTVVIYASSQLDEQKCSNENLDHSVYCVSFNSIALVSREK